MATLGSPVRRYFATARSPCWRATQRRWARVHDIRFVTTTHQENRILERYKDKLDQKAKAEGLQSIAELKKAYQDKIRHVREGNDDQSSSHNAPVDPLVAPSPPTPQTTSDTAAAAATRPPPAPRLTSKSKPAIQTLSSFLDVAKVRTLPPAELETVWRLRHAANPNSLCAVLPTTTWRAIEATARAHPHFILPLPRPDGAPGASIHFLQWTFPAPDAVAVLFTHLAEYKLRGEFSAPHTVVTHHLELAADRGLVLLQGQVVEGRGVSVADARWLLMCMQKFYGLGARDSGRLELLEKFRRGDDSFRLEDLVDQAEKLV